MSQYSSSEEGLGFDLLPTQQPLPTSTDKSVISRNPPTTAIFFDVPSAAEHKHLTSVETDANIHRRPLRAKPNSVPESALATPTILSSFLRPPMSPPPSSDLLSSPAQQRSGELESDLKARVPVQLHGCGLSRADRAWAYWTALGRPSLLVVPMVDNSELQFRMLCRKYGARAAYTPMLHSRIFTENEKYRSQEFTT